MDITTLAAAKTYTNNKVEEIIKGGDTSVVDPTLSLSGAAADAKVTGDRLGAIEYQNVITDIDFEHNGLPEGEKVVLIYGDGNFGNNAYVSTGKDLIPRKTFNKTFPHNGITITKNDKTYHIEGTNALNDSLSIHFGQTPNDINIELDETLIGKTLKLMTFASETAENLGLVVELRNSDNTRLERKSMYVAKTNTYNSSTVVVPEGTIYMRVAFSVPAGITLNHDIQVYAVVDEDTQAIDLNSSLTAEVDTTVSELFTFPYQSTVSTKLSLVDYIGYTADNSEGGTVTYLTPEDFGAIGDGFADDSVPISLCLATAATTKQTVLMAKKYYISNPIDISQDGLHIIINDIEYDGTDVAIKIRGCNNTIKVHSIDSKGSGINFIADGTKHITYNDVEVNTIISKSHGIGLYSSPVSIYQNTVRFNYIKAGGTGSYGIGYFLADDGTFVTENNFYGGQIANCEWAVYKCGGNSRFYGLQIENNVQGGFLIQSGCTLFYPRIAEASRGGSLPFYKVIGSTRGVHIYETHGVAINEIDLSDAEENFTNDAGLERPLHEGLLGTINGRIMTRLPGTGVNGNVPNTYCMSAYTWGKFIIMQPFIAYRKVVTTETLDTRLIGRTEETDAEIMSLAQLPTKYVVNAVNSEIYLHSSYCAFGFNEFEVEQSNGFTCKVYDRLENLIFDGTDKGDGLYKFNVYKDSEFCADYSSGLLRRDFLGHYWNVEKINIPTKISQLENDLGLTSGSNGSASIQSSEFYELIETITLAEDTTSVTRNQYPDGTAYKFKELYLKMVCPTATTAGSARYKIKAGTSTLLNANVSNATSTSASNASSVKFGDTKGIYESTIYLGGGGGIRNVQYYNSLTQPHTRAEKGAITEWEITADSCEVLPAGTVIYAYGIKDYEK